MAADPAGTNDVAPEAPDAWSWEDEVDPWRLSRVERGRKLSTWEVRGATCDERPPPDSAG